MYSFIIKIFSKKAKIEPKPESRPKNKRWEMNFRSAQVAKSYLDGTSGDSRFITPLKQIQIEETPYEFYVSWDPEGLRKASGFEDKIKVTRQFVEYVRDMKGVGRDYLLGAQLRLGEDALKLDTREALYIADRCGCYKTTFAQSIAVMGMLNGIYYQADEEKLTPQGLFFGLGFRLLQLWTDNLFPLVSPDPEKSLVKYAIGLKCKDGTFDFRCLLPKDVPAPLYSVLESHFYSDTMFRTYEEGFAAFEEMCEVLPRSLATLPPVC